MATHTAAAIAIQSKHVCAMCASRWWTLHLLTRPEGAAPLEELLAAAAAAALIVAAEMPEAVGLRLRGLAAVLEPGLLATTV